MLESEGGDQGIFDLGETSDNPYKGKPTSHVAITLSNVNLLAGKRGEGKKVYFSFNGQVYSMQEGYRVEWCRSEPGIKPKDPELAKRDMEQWVLEAKKYEADPKAWKAKNMPKKTGKGPGVLEKLVDRFF